MVLESDSGGFTPRGFSFDCSEEEFEQVKSWEPLFKPYLIHYFDYHHASNDTFEAVNKRELKLGAATMASLVYLYDKYGTKKRTTQPVKN